MQTLTREKRFARFDHHKIEQLVIEQPKQQSCVGNIYYGIVRDIIPGMNAAFIDIGMAKKGFLHRNKLPSFHQLKQTGKANQQLPISRLIHQGQKLLVQVEKDATGTKGPRLTGILEFEGEFLIYLPEGRYVAVSKKLAEETRMSWRTFGSKIKEEQEGLIFRTACATIGTEVVREEIKRLRKTYSELIQRANQCKQPTLLHEKDTFFHRLLEEINLIGSGEVIVDDLAMKKQLNRIYRKDSPITITNVSYQDHQAAYDQIDHEIEKALKHIVWLDNGAYLVIDETEALTIIDVNTGKFLGKSDLQQTVLTTNELAVKAIAREVRIRDLSGMILVDLIDMKSDKDRLSVLKLAHEQFANDSKRTNVVGFTSLGILQLTRKKTNVSLSESLTEKCPTCQGSGRVLSAYTVAFQLERQLWAYRSIDHDAVLIEATNDVRTIFAGKNDEHLQRLEKALQITIYLKVVEKEKPSYAIRQFGTNKEIADKLDQNKTSEATK